MTNCSSTSTRNDTPKQAVCPLNGQAYSQVSLRTVLHHVTKPWQHELRSQAYYFCDDPDCEVVYFGNDQQLIRQNELRLTVGQKSHSPDKHICYCFDIRMTDLQGGGDHEKLKTFVIEQTRDSTCDCEIRNPSGRCCLKDFPRDENQ
jgi:hypothetical protein